MENRAPNSDSPPFREGCSYLIVTLFSWPILLIAALGLADAVFGLRRRYLQGRSPPSPHPKSFKPLK